MTYRLIHGDCLASLRAMEPESVDCCVTSPPYWGLRDYGVDGQMGLESTPAEYVARIVEVFREVRRVLKDDGTLWLNLGDSYASSTKGSGGPDLSSTLVGTAAQANGQRMEPRAVEPGLPSKNLIGIPWRVAFALQADGWYLRSDIIWSKPNPMPESVTDRPTKAHEYVFLLSKSERYYYDADAIAEDALCAGKPLGSSIRYDGRMGESGWNREGDAQHKTRNKRTVWTIATEPCAEAHFAVMPTALVKPCVLAGCRPGGTVLDPFTGSGTVGVVAQENGCDFIGCELNPEYVKIADARLSRSTRAPMLPFAPTRVAETAPLQFDPVMP